MSWLRLDGWDRITDQTAVVSHRSTSYLVALSNGLVKGTTKHGRADGNRGGTLRLSILSKRYGIDYVLDLRHLRHISLLMLLRALKLHFWGTVMTDVT